MPDEFTQPELHIESANPQIISLAEKLSKGKRTACEQVRAFYDYAGDKLLYTYNRQDWGAQATFGLMGSDCSEYASLVIALSRAESIPARYYEGLLYLEERSGNKNEEIAQTEHAWLDVYLPGALHTQPHHCHYRQEPFHLAGSELLVSYVLAGQPDHYPCFRIILGHRTSPIE